MIEAVWAALLAAAPLVPVGEGWTVELRTELNEGLAALPPKLREFPGGPLELELHPTPAPFGMGAGTAELPDWSDGHRRFHLYALGAITERRATWRLEALTPEEHERLWRRRAVVHAVLQRWEDAEHVSRHADWRSLNGWLGALERPFTWSERALNLADAAYSRARGKQSPQLDLLTFAEEHFVPVESVHPGAIAVDDQVRCQDFSKARVLHARLGLEPKPSVACPAFERWAQLLQLQQLEVLLVQATGRRAESLFGHVLIRPVHREDDEVRGPSFDSAIELAALTDPDTGVRHLMTGVFGGYRMTVFTVSWRDFERSMLEDEQRSIRRFRLELTAQQQRQVLERSWELERRGEFNYQFLSDNCATGLGWLLQGALGEQLVFEQPGAGLVSPGAVMDGLARSTVGGKPLLTRLLDDFESTSDRAERSEKLRAPIEARVLAQVPAGEAREWAKQFEAARAFASLTRRAAYEAIEQRTRRHPLPALYDWWALTVRIERLSADRADQDLRTLNRQTLLPGAHAPYDPRAELANRQRLFERETQLQRHWMMLDRAEHTQRALAALPHRPMTAGEQRDEAMAKQALQTFDRLTALHGAVVNQVFPRFDGQAWLEADRAQKSGARAVGDLQSQPQSGHWRTLVGGGAWVDAEGQVRPVLALQSSGLAELLGDQRVRGFHSSSELRVLDSELILAPHLGWPEVVHSRFTLFAYRSIKRELPQVAEGALSRFGWGMGLDTDYRRGRSLPARTSLGAELLWIGGHDERFASFLTAGLGAAGFVGWGGDGPFAPAIAPYAVLAARVPLPGHGADGLRFEGRAQLAIAPTLAQKLLPELRASASLDLMVGELGGRTLLIKPQGWVQSEPGLGPAQLVGVVALELL